MAKYTSKLLECLHSKVFEVCLTIFHHDTFSAWSLLKGHTFLNKQAVFSCTHLFRIVWTFCGHQTWKSFAWMQKKQLWKGLSFLIFYDGGLYHTETSVRNQIYSANPWTGCYMIGTSVMKELISEGEYHS